MKRLFSSTLLLLLLASPHPARATVQPEARDPIEEASATLSRHLRELEASRAELRRLRALEQSRVRGIRLLSSRFLLPNGSFLGQGSLIWLIGQRNPTQTGIVPIAGRAGLLVSYVVPPGHDLGF